MSETCSINCKTCRSRIVIKSAPKRQATNDKERIKALEEKVIALEAVIQALKDNLVTVNKFNGEGSFKALNINFV